ncbi:VCBS repeat-containing protein [Tamlana sp. 2201CG12-4]|uniref:VCBS repeat-containing protein n=1 Tax=Tamlana sp. 2201CG12-4 TaxID=3112582 RepID=UPI002DB5B28C|nr:VCBS repeat-containing protein [Tamlana sp. 2201CG12-4]MEC3907877.1 VCBS repeat-containing protein [Tamlana sp. 2201CG12-4]
MPNSNVHVIRILWLMLVLVSCNTAPENNQSLNSEALGINLFTVLTEEQTGITSKNVLRENTYMNGFLYEYYYNGGGVAVADFNNDSLIDIYFINNLQPNQLYLNQGNMRFKEVSKISGTQGSRGFPTGVTIVDINNDGYKDIYICYSGSPSNKDLLKNQLLVNQGINDKGVPHFVDKAATYNLDLAHHAIQAAFFDYDRDGDLDMFAINHGLQYSYLDHEIDSLSRLINSEAGEKLYRNDHNKFIEVTHDAGIVSNALGYTLGVSIGDLNNDGWPDVYTANDYAQKDHIYINNKNGTFEETSHNSFRHISNFSMGTDIADINNDGWLDIMSLDMMAKDNYSQKTSMSGMNPERFFNYVNWGLHHQYMYNAMHLNRGIDYNTNAPVFSDIAKLAGVSSTDWSWSPLLFDFNNDGYNDLFVSNGIKRDFRSNDFKIYKEKKREEARKAGVLNKDKYIADLLEKSPTRRKNNYFFLNQGDLTFSPLDLEQPMTFSNGAAYADFDNDGDLDVVVNNSDDPSFIYRNNSNAHHGYLKVKLIGQSENKDALGAKVELITATSKQTRENYFTRGFQSSMANNLHFGLGQKNIVDTLRIHWPDGKIEEKYKVSSNQVLTVRYGQGLGIEKVSQKENYIFKDRSAQLRIPFTHQENDYDDFKEEALMPHKMSESGPALAKADVNNDGLEDFYVGGAQGQSGVLYVQSETGIFYEQNIEAFLRDRKHEDTGALFLDADKDGDMDLYVVSGGNEMDPNSDYYTDRFYENNGIGNFTRNLKAIPTITQSGQSIASGDFDNDGDLDLFVGTRVMPKNYGKPVKSFLLENKSDKGKIQFIDVTDTAIPDLNSFSMITNVYWQDMDGDNKQDLLITSEWGAISLFKNMGHEFRNISSSVGLTDYVGWWYCLKVMDVDGDGDQDLIAGNLGLNYKYKASPKEPFYMFINDFDDNHSTDIVLGYHEGETVYPLRGRECSSNQMPFIKEKFESYHAFGKANLHQVYGNKLKSSLKYTATTFASGVFENRGSKGFHFKPFPNEAQISSINKILSNDFDKDGSMDLLLLGNLYGSEVETPRNDASYGHVLKKDAYGNFFEIPSTRSGLYIKGEVKNAVEIATLNGNLIIIAKNNEPLTVLEY